MINYSHKKLDEYEYHNQEEISFNKHKYVSASIININKLLLPYLDKPNNYEILKSNYQDNLHSVTDYITARSQLLKKINKFNSRFYSDGRSEFLCDTRFIQDVWNI